MEEVLYKDLSGLNSGEYAKESLEEKGERLNLMTRMVEQRGKKGYEIKRTA